MKQSAGLLVFRRKGLDVEVLLVHLAGPFWAKKDVWSIPKGELDEGEDAWAAAQREFEEELNIKPPESQKIDLGHTIEAKSKANYIWAVEGDPDLTNFKSNTFTMEWPPKSGKQQEFPENDRAAWFGLVTAKQKLFKSQMPFIDRLAEHLGVEIPALAAPEQQTLI